MLRLDKHILTRSQGGGNGLVSHFLRPRSVYPDKSTGKRAVPLTDLFLLYDMDSEKPLSYA